MCKNYVFGACFHYFHPFHTGPGKMIEGRNKDALFNQSSINSFQQVDSAAEGGRDRLDPGWPVPVTMSGHEGEHNN